MHCQLTLIGSLHAELEGKDLNDLEAGRCLQEIVLTCPDTQRRRGEAFSLGIGRLNTSLFTHTERCCSDPACKSQEGAKLYLVLCRTTETKRESSIKGF